LRERSLGIIDRLRKFKLWALVDLLARPFRFFDIMELLVGLWLS
jgi:hypothetical protein